MHSIHHPHSDSTSRPHVLDVLRQVAVPVFVLTSIIINYWVNSNRPFGADNKQVSDTFFTLLNPAPFAFSIWALIYIGALVVSIYQLAPSRRSLPFWRIIGHCLIIASVFNALFPIAYTNYRIDLAFLAVVGLFLSLLPAYQQVLNSHGLFNSTSRALVSLPIRLYFGWAAVALTACAAQVLQYLGWRSVGDDALISAIVVMALLVAAAFWLARQFNDMVVPLVFTWALIAIAVQQQQIEVIETAAFVAALLTLTAAILAAYWQSLREKHTIVLDDRRAQSI